MLVPLLLGMVLPACERPDLSEAWMIDRLRVLAVQATPAEPRPGETVTFSALVSNPSGADVAVLWFACLASSADDYGCATDMSALGDLGALLEGLSDPSQLTPDEMAELYEEMQAAGLIGVDPFLPPTYTIPADILDGLTDEERAEGLNLMLTLMAIPSDATSDADMEMAYKRVPVSDAETPNQNPEIVRLRVDDQDVKAGFDAVIPAGATVTLEPVISETSIEEYVYVTSTGEEEARTEEPYFTFFVTGGELDPSYSLYPHGAVTYTAPATLGAVDAWVVAQDRRGGMTWWSQSLTIQ